jgi:hypothetical protein
MISRSVADFTSKYIYFRYIKMTRMKLYLQESLNVEIIDNITHGLQNMEYHAF